MQRYLSKAWRPLADTAHDAWESLTPRQAFRFAWQIARTTPYASKSDTKKLARDLMSRRLKRGEGRRLDAAINAAIGARLGRDKSSPDLHQRLIEHKRRKAFALICDRAASTPAGFSRENLHYSGTIDGIILWTYEDNYEYSKRAGTWRVAAAFLTGIDDGQPWAVRVPSTMTNVSAALNWLKPRMIREAEDKGLPVRRQGDIYFRPMRLNEHCMGAIRYSRHEPRPRQDGGLTIVHPEHKPIRLSGKHTWRAYQQQQIDGNGHACGD